MQFWNELEGQVLEGIYPLHRLVRSEGRTAWFETSTGENAGQVATISVIESLTDTDEVLQRLQAAQNLKHPNLLTISKIGKTSIENTPVLYVLMEHTDQNLSEVLREQALSKEDVRQVAEALIGALTAIHQQGLVHGRVEAASVFAVGDSVKLRSDCMQSPGGTRAGDIAGIGAILFQAFTQRKAPSPDDPQINRIPAPFSEIVRNSLSARWSLAQIASALRPATGAAATTAPQTSPARAGSAPHVGPPAPAAEPRPPAPANPAAKPPATESTPQVGGGAGPAVKAPPQPPAPPRPPIQPQPAVPSAAAIEPRSQEQPGPAPKKPLGLYAVVALVVLLILGWLVFRPKSPAPSTPNANSASTPPAPPPTTKPSLNKPSAIPAPAGMQAITPTAARNTGARSVWRVVAYTYNRQDRAQKKVDEIARQHSDLQVSVFAPHGNRAPYLVIIGGPMDRDHAFELRDQARRMGLPSDTYAQNFSE